MAKYVIDGKTLTDIADSIRAKKGTTEYIPPENMSTEIASIETGGGGEVEITLQGKAVTPTKSQQNITADEGFTALGEVIVYPIPDNYIDPSGTKAITANGTHDVNAYEKVSVNVPIPDGYIKPSGTKSITENGTHDVTAYASVNVSVPSEAPNIQPLEITENGTYTAPSGVDGYSPIVVNVAGSGGGGGEDHLDDFLTNKTTALNSDVTSIVTYGGYGRTALQTINLPNCTTINSYAFRGCTGLTQVSAPLATTIATYAFYGCSKLADVNMPKVSSLGTYAFYKCNLRSVNFPNVTGIAQNAFFQNENLQRADFGVANKINQASFGNCSSLVTLILRRTGSICTLGVASNGFSGTPIAEGTGYVYVPAALIETYKTATNWVNYASQFRAIEDYPEICG